MREFLSGSWLTTSKVMHRIPLMRDHEQAMKVYARLAEISHRKKQSSGTDKFLVLTGIAAVRAGWPEVAARCRELVLAHNPRHRLGDHESFADSMRDAEFQTIVRQLERFCPVETGEALLLGQGAMPEVSAESTAGEFALTAMNSLE